jgi:hypothetical protein
MLKGISPTLYEAAGAATGGGGTGTGDPKPAGTGEGFDPQLFVDRKTFDGVAAALRRFEGSLKSIQDAQLTSDKLVELGVLEKAEDGVYRPKAHVAGNGDGPDGKGKPKPDDEWKKRMETTVANLNTKLADKDKELAAERERVEQSERKRAVIAALTKAGAVNPERDHVHLVGQVQRVDGNLVAKGKDEFGAETTVTLDDLAIAYLKTNPELARAQAQTGSGTPAGGGSGAGGSTGKVIPKAQWNDAAFMAANKKRFDTGELTYGP